MLRRSLGALVSLAFVGMVSLPVGVTAQEGSPVAELGPPSASECVVQPRSEAEMAALSGTPTATEGASEATAPMALPEGTPVDAATQAAIEQTLREVVACAKAGDVARLLALFSDDAVRRIALANNSVPIVPGQPSGVTGTRPATPPANADVTPVVQEARLLPDGRVAALVTSVAPGSQVEVVIFVQSGGRWVIDEVHPLAMPGATPVTGADNPMVQTVVADAATRLGVPADQLQVVSIESWDWPDTSLGCPQEGQFYAQVITPGYLIVVSGAGQRLEYHTDTEGHFVVCEQG
jgi:hypothetical protein